MADSNQTADRLVFHANHCIIIIIIIIIIHL